MNASESPDSGLSGEMTGKNLGQRYLITGTIAVGGMSVVYKAKDLMFDEVVAIKALKREFSADPELIRGFGKEAKIQARLHHPNIVTLRDVLLFDGDCYLVMEFVDGESIDQIIRREGPIPYPQAIRLFKQALAGIGYAHRSWIIHGDIKPRNLLVSRNGIVKVLDFGIARIANERAARQGNTLVGTPAYIAPEQIERPEPDLRSDIYALGVSLYEMLTGDLPFRGDTVSAILADKLTQQPEPLTTHCPSLPAGLQTVVLKALARDPDARFQNVEEFGAELDRAVLIPQKQQTSPPTSPPARSEEERATATVPLAALLDELRRRASGPGGAVPESSAARTDAERATAAFSLDELLEEIKHRAAGAQAAAPGSSTAQTDADRATAAFSLDALVNEIKHRASGASGTAPPDARSTPSAPSVPDDPRRATAVGLPVPRPAAPAQRPADAQAQLGDTAAFALDAIRYELEAREFPRASSAPPSPAVEGPPPPGRAARAAARIFASPGPASATRVLERTLDLAMAPTVPVMTPVELIALIRRPESASLADLLETDRDTDLKKGDVRGRNFGLEFEADAAGRLQPVDVTMRVVAPDFVPPRLAKVVRVRPQEDCERQTFLLTPQRTGDLRVQFDVLRGNLTLASRALKTQSEPSDRVQGNVNPLVVSVPLSVQVRRRRRWLGMAVAAALLFSISVGGLWLWTHRGPASESVDRGVNTKQNPAAIGAALSTLNSGGKQYALLIGIDSYKHLHPLQTAVRDARSVGALLHDRYGFETRYLTDASRSQIVKALNDYRRELDENANLLIYYAGHGSYDKGADKAYWLPVDAEPTDTTNWILADEITTDVKVISAHHILVISDSCYSGGISRDVAPEFNPQERDRYLLKMSQGRSRTLMSSGGLEPVSDKGSGGHSVFAVALIKGLAESPDAAFSAENLFDRYIRVPVAGQSEQSPQYSAIRNSGHEAGDFVFLRRDVPSTVGGAPRGSVPPPPNQKPVK